VDSLLRLVPLIANLPLIEGMIKLATVVADPRTAEGFMKLAAALADPRTLETLSRLITVMSDPRLGEAVAVLADPKILAAVVTLTAVIGFAMAPPPAAELWPQRLADIRVEIPMRRSGCSAAFAPVGAQIRGHRS